MSHQRNVAPAAARNLDLGAERRARDPIKLDRAKRTVKAAGAIGTLTYDELIHDILSGWPPATPELKADLAALLGGE